MQQKSHTYHLFTYSDLSRTYRSNGVLSYGRYVLSPSINLFLAANSANNAKIAIRIVFCGIYTSLPISLRSR